MATEIRPANRWDANRFVGNMLLDEKLELQKMRTDPCRLIKLTLKASKRSYALMFEDKVCGLVGVRPDPGLPDSAALFWLFGGQVAATEGAIFQREVRKAVDLLAKEFDPLVQMIPANHKGLGWWREIGWQFGDPQPRPAGPPMVPSYFTKKGESFGRTGKVDFGAEAQKRKSSIITLDGLGDRL